MDHKIDIIKTNPFEASYASKPSISLTQKKINKRTPVACVQCNLAKTSCKGGLSLLSNSFSYPFFVLQGGLANGAPRRTSPKSVSMSYIGRKGGRRRTKWL